MSVKNAKPKRYRTKFIEPGLADYTAEGFGTVLVNKEALDRMLPSFVGKPVFLEHSDVSPEDAFENNGDETDADGVVSDVGYDDESGWYWADLMIWDQEVQNAIEKKGYTVSCAYDVNEADGKGGSYHNIRYNQSVIDGEYTHMAVVNNPRYEDATIELRNSKIKQGGKQVKVFKLLGKKGTVKNEAPEEVKKEDEEVMNADGETMIDLGDGQQVALSELVAAYKEEMAEEEQMMNADDEIEYDEGKKAKVGDMINTYKNRSRKNAEPPQDEEAEPVVDEKKQMQNAAPAKPNQNFKKVQNAAVIGGEPAKPILNTRDERIALGKKRYSSKAKEAK